MPKRHINNYMVYKNFCRRNRLLMSRSAWRRAGSVALHPLTALQWWKKFSLFPSSQCSYVWFSKVKTYFSFKFLKLQAQIPVSSGAWQDYLEYGYKCLCKLLTDTTIKAINKKYPCQVVLDMSIYTRIAKLKARKLPVGVWVVVYFFYMGNSPELSLV